MNDDGWHARTWRQSQGRGLGSVGCRFCDARIALEVVARLRGVESCCFIHGGHCIFGCPCRRACFVDILFARSANQSSPPDAPLVSRTRVSCSCVSLSLGPRKVLREGKLARRAVGTYAPLQSDQQQSPLVKHWPFGEPRRLEKTWPRLLKSNNLLFRTVFRLLCAKSGWR